MFNSQTDTEVFLNAWRFWGDKCLPKLLGMFAFVIVDRQEMEFHIVRDAFGIKPLFISSNSETISYSSVIGALKTIIDENPKLNLQRAYDYLILQSYDDSKSTFFDGIEQLMPGHILTISLHDNKKLEERRWWWPSIEENSDISFNTASDQLRQMFLDTVHLHLRSDVPWGVALSGGIDSSAVVCAIRHLNPDLPIHTFSYIARNSAVDEERWVNIVNKKTEAIAHKVIVSPEEFVSDLDDVIKLQGEPFGTTSIYAQYRVFKLAKDCGITVTLDGQGADELLAGYSGYPEERIISLIENHRYVELAKFIYEWSKWPGRKMDNQVKFAWERISPGTFDTSKKIKRALFGGNEISRDYSWIDYNILSDLEIDENMPLSFIRPTDTQYRQLMSTLRNELTHRSLLPLLRHADRNSMRFSIESRVPFLTIPITEFVLSLQEEFLISQKGETKSIFRHAMRGIVPDSILDRKDKIGFTTPEDEWFHIMGESFYEMTWNADKIPFINKKQLHTEIKDTLNGKIPYNSRLWRIVNLCRWMDLNEVSI